MQSSTCPICVSSSSSLATPPSLPLPFSIYTDLHDHFAIYPLFLYCIHIYNVFTNRIYISKILNKSCNILQISLKEFFSSSFFFFWQTKVLFQLPGVNIYTCLWLRIKKFNSCLSWYHNKWVIEGRKFQKSTSSNELFLFPCAPKKMQHFLFQISNIQHISPLLKIKRNNNFNYKTKNSENDFSNTY